MLAPSLYWSSVHGYNRTYVVYRESDENDRRVINVYPAGIGEKQIFMLFLSLFLDVALHSGIESWADPANRNEFTHNESTEIVR